MRGLWIGDHHWTVNTVGDGRAEAIGKLAHAEKVDYVVQIGDFLSSNAVNPYNKKGSKGAKECPYILEELQGLNEELRILHSFINPKKSKKKKIPYIQCIGNHEIFFARYEKENAEFTGMLWYPLLNVFDRYSNVLVPYGQVFNFHGVNFTHVPIISGSRLQGKYACYRVAEYAQTHTVFGHVHYKANVTMPKMGRETPIEVFNIGCTLLEEEEYALHDSAENWSYGLYIAEHDEEKIKRTEWIAMSEIMKGA